MLKKPSLVRRVAVGKGVGFLIGFIGFLALPYSWPEASIELQLGVLFWYATVGAIIGMVGVWNRHPVLNFPMPWFVRAPIVGAWMNFVLMLFAEAQFRAMLIGMFGADSPLASPYWFVLEGALVGLLIGWLATRIGGEGAETVSGAK